MQLVRQLQIWSKEKRRMKFDVRLILKMILQQKKFVDIFIYVFNSVFRFH